MLTRKTKDELLAVAREHRSLEPSLVEQHLTGGRTVVANALEFLAWCRRTGTTFGHGNIDAVVARFEAAGFEVG